MDPAQNPMQNAVDKAMAYGVMNEAALENSVVRLYLTYPMEQSQVPGTRALWGLLFSIPVKVPIQFRGRAVSSLTP